MDRHENPFLSTIRLPIRPAGEVIVLLVLGHFVALFVIWFSAIDLIYKFILAVCTIFGLIHIAYRHKFCSSKAKAQELILGSEDAWQIKLINGDIHQAILADSLFVHPVLVIILLKYYDHAEYFIFTPSNIEAELFRRLRVRLRFKLDKDI